MRNHTTSGSTENMLGRYTILSPALEEELKARINRFADIGLPLTKQVIQLLYAIKVNNWLNCYVQCTVF